MRPIHPLDPIDALTVTIGFDCNAQCVMCLLGKDHKRYTPVSFERFKSIVEENIETGAFERLLLSGGEVTLLSELADFVHYAKERKAFRHIQIQTNGRSLHDIGFASSLVGAGVDEFYVSLHADEDALLEKITRRKGIGKILAGLENVKKLGAALITNTTILAPNVERLVEITRLLLSYDADLMEFYGFVPLSDDEDQLALMASLAKIQPFLLSAMDEIKRAGVTASVKWIPECILERHRESYLGILPTTIIGDDFWQGFPAFSCLYEQCCPNFPTCSGLHHRYIRRFGWEAKMLHPPARQEEQPAKPSPKRGNTTQEKPKRQKREAYLSGTLDETLWRDLLRDKNGRAITTTAAWKLAGVLLLDRAVAYRFLLATGESVEIHLQKKDTQTPHAAATRHYNLTLRQKAMSRKGRALSSKLLQAVSACLDLHPKAIELPAIEARIIHREEES